MVRVVPRLFSGGLGPTGLVGPRGEEIALVAPPGVEVADDERTAAWAFTVEPVDAGEEADAGGGGGLVGHAGPFLGDAGRIRSTVLLESTRTVQTVLSKYSEGVVLPCRGGEGDQLRPPCGP